MVEAGTGDTWADSIWTLFGSNEVLIEQDIFPSLYDMQGHAFVVHANDGSRIGCGILRPFVHGESPPVSFEPQPS